VLKHQPCEIARAFQIDFRDGEASGAQLQDQMPVVNPGGLNDDRNRFERYPFFHRHLGPLERLPLGAVSPPKNTFLYVRGKENAVDSTIFNYKKTA